MRRAAAFLVSLMLSFAMLAGSVDASVGHGAATYGGGRFLLQGTLDVHFAFAGVSLPSGRTIGAFYQSYTDAGLTTTYWGRVTCLAFDQVNNRAWVGGVLTKVQSNDPAETHMAGDDAWFRVVDYGRGGAVPDRSTVYGFKGPLFETSAQYCAAQIWPADDARTWRVTVGDIAVR